MDKDINQPNHCLTWGHFFHFQTQLILKLDAQGLEALQRSPLDLCILLGQIVHLLCSMYTIFIYFYHLCLYLLLRFHMFFALAPTIALSGSLSRRQDECEVIYKNGEGFAPSMVPLPRCGRVDPWTSIDSIQWGKSG